MNVTTNPTDKAVAVLQLQVQPRGESDSASFTLLPLLSVTPGTSPGRPSPAPDRCLSSHREPRCSVIIRTGCSPPALRSPFISVASHRRRPRLLPAVPPPAPCDTLGATLFVSVP